MFSSTALNDEGHYRFGHLAAGTYFVVVRAHPWYALNGEVVRVGKMRQVENVPDGTVMEAVADADSSTAEVAEAEPKQGRELDVAYPLTYYPGVTEESAATPIVVEAGQRTTADMRLTAIPAVHLRVHAPGLEESDGLRADVVQKIFDAPGQSGEENTRSDANEVEIWGIAPGDYELRMQSLGKNPQSWTQQVTVSGDAEITVSRQPSGSLVKGTIRMETGATPPKTGFVQLSSRETGRAIGAQILDKGEIEFAEPVPAGR